MSIFKPLVIGDLKAERPVIQGGMGVGISLSSLAGAVAKAGGIGIISTAQIGFRDPDFLKAPLEANLRAIKTEFDKARAHLRSRTSGVPAGVCQGNEDTDCAYCVHGQVGSGDLQDVGPEVWPGAGSGGD